MPCLKRGLKATTMVGTDEIKRFTNESLVCLRLNKTGKTTTTELYGNLSLLHRKVAVRKILSMDYQEG